MADLLNILDAGGATVYDAITIILGVLFVLFALALLLARAVQK